MFQSLVLKNFQNHKLKKIEFSPTVTTIVGASDEGKTSILRGLCLLCLNRPSGYSYVKDGSKRATVSLEVDNRKIRRARGKGVNGYYLDGKRFAAFRNGVPSDIEDVLKIGDVNFQGQIAFPYLFTESPGRVAKHLNLIINLQIIDQTVANCASELRSARSSLQATTERLIEARKNKKDLSFVPNLIEEYNQLKEIKEDHDTIVIKSRLLRSIIEQGERHYSIVDRANLGHSRGKELIAIGTSARELQDQSKQLQNLINQIKDESLVVHTPEPNIKRLLSFRDKGDKLAENRRNLEWLVNDFLKEQKEFNLLDTTLKATEKILHKKSKGRCPICGQKIA